MGSLTVFTARLVAPVGTRAIWPQSGQRTVEPGETDVTSIEDWQRGHFRILAMVPPLFLTANIYDTPAPAHYYRFFCPAATEW
jgi:hypothetical protein